MLFRKTRFLLNAAILISVIAATVSCSKTGPGEIGDEIIYKNYSPSLQYFTVLNFSLEDHGVCTADIPFPEDSVITFGLDLNDDNYNDVLIDVSHNRWEGDQYCGHCSIFEYQITISGVNENNLISNNPLYSWEPRWYNEGDTISPSHSWHKEIFISMQGGCQRPFVDLQDAYVGIKHNNNYGYIHVRPMENNGIEIVEHGINMMDGRIIRAGQKN